MRRRTTLGILVLLGLVLMLTVGATGVAADCLLKREVTIQVDCPGCPDSGFLVTIKDSGGNTVFQELTGTDGEHDGSTVDEMLCPGDYTYSITKQCFKTMTGSFTVYRLSPFVWIERDAETEDNVAPTITCPANVTVPAGAACQATNVALGNPTVSDPCDPNPIVTNNAPNVYPLGDTIVTWTATDHAGKSSTCQQKVTVVDQTPPAITCPADVTAGTNSGCTAVNVALGTPIATDNCGVKSVTNDAPAAFPLGDTTITWTVEDNAGLKATCTQKVTVADDDLPTITCPADVSVQAGVDCTATNVNLGTPVTADNCGVKSVTNNAPAVFPLGNTTVTWTVEDNAGLKATCTQKVTVYENTAPVVTISSPGNGAYVHGTITINGTVTDNNNFEIRVIVNDRLVGTSLPCEWDTTQFRDGGAMVTIAGIDCAGNVGQAYVDVWVDNTAPMPPIITGSRSDATGAGGDAPFRLIGVDEDNARIQIWAKGPNNADFVFLGATVADSCGRWVYTGAPLEPGAYVIRAGAKDAAGNWSGWSETFEIEVNPSEIIEVQAFQEGEKLIDSDEVYAGTLDATIDSYEPDLNEGDTGSLNVRQGDVKAALVKFDVSSIPADWTVKRAVLAIYVGGSTNQVRRIASVTNVETVKLVQSGPDRRGMTITAYGMLTMWNEMYSTWNSPWAVPGANGIGTDRSDVALDSAFVNMDDGWVTLDITDEVARWVADPTVNLGVIIKGSGDASVEYLFRSSEWWEVCRRPRLMLTIGHQ